MTYWTESQPAFLGRLTPESAAHFLGAPKSRPTGAGAGEERG
jgi:hypothetical protein